MCELDREIRRWRRQEIRRSSLSPRELDELEDHLRARVELELELDTARSPQQAFALAWDELGGGRALSCEFARAGRPRWRGLMAVAGVLFGASFFLPVIVAELQTADGMVPRYGYEAVLRLLADGELSSTLLALGPNLLMVVALVGGLGSDRSQGRWLRGIVGLAGLALLLIGVTNLLWPASVSLNGGPPFHWPAPNPVTSTVHYLADLGIGYWAWALSFACATAGLWIRDREWASAEPRRASA
ncbi:MAG: hypothetical protein OXR82_00485 [Gammaproteobacteria bacterium]|nr:hypothetical protein [Gammaproteobacteria bacterium]MDE0256847.1 hypothetical protein [Gammaproteobacteria bacterium]